MLQPELVDVLKTMLPESLHANAMVAGGFAVDPSKAGDIDLWVLTNKFKAFDVEVGIRNHLIDQRLLSTDAPLTVGSGVYEEFSHDFKVVAEIGLPHATAFEFPATTVQIILGLQPDFMALLNRFDLSMHQKGYALMEPTIPLYAPTFTTLAEQPRVVLFTRPQQTLNRIDRLFPRYGFTPTKQDIAFLRLQLVIDGWEAAA